MNPRRHIDLFSGIGGFALAAHWAGFTTEVFCERDEFCQHVLSHHWPAVPVIPDIRDFDGIAYRGADLLTGGFPCQPFSCAGKRQGEADDRFLWPEMLRVIREARPTWIVGENVAGIINMALDGVLSDLENEGYTTQAFVIPACAINAPHKRDRVWIVAHSTNIRCKRHTAITGSPDTSKKERRMQQSTGKSEVMADAPQFPERKPANQANAFATSREARDELGIRYSFATNSNSQPPRRATEPRRQCSSGQSQSRVCDVAHGLPGRMDGHFDSEPAHIPRIATGIPQRAAKLKALGNAIVPQVAYEILRHL